MKNITAFIISLIIPGLGHIYKKNFHRGFLILFSFFTIISLSVWRISIIAHRYSGFFSIIRKSLSTSPFFTLFLIIFSIILWIWIAFDAYKFDSSKKSFAIFILILIVFFGLGWQISEIDLAKAAMQFPAAWKPLSKVLWPWQAAITYKTEILSANARIVIDNNYNLPEEKKDNNLPFVETFPKWGTLAYLDKSNNVIKGSEITVKGSGFIPDKEAQVWWIDSVGNEFRPREDGSYLSVTPDKDGKFIFKMTLPYRLVPPSAEGDQIHKVEIRQVSTVGGPIPSDPLKLTIVRMIETIFMGLMATVFGVIFSIPVSFLAARNIMSGSKITILIYYITRTILNIIRSIEPLIWALIAVVWVGLGPFAGIIALTIHSIAALGKLYSESIENIDTGPVEAIKATGANSIQIIMFAVIPQVIPSFISFSIYRWDINLRMSTVIGLVGGGGIGFLLVQYIRLLDYNAAGIAVWFIAITVAILDYVSSQIRRKFI